MAQTDTFSEVHTRETRDGAREVKFLVTASHAADVLAWSRTRLAADPHAGGPTGDEYRTTTIYFETNGRDVYERRGSFGRSKYRMRRYGASDVAFLERKLRTSSLLNKRRSSIACSELPELLARDSERPGHRWFVERVLTRGLSPICQVSYRRHALVGTTAHGPMRLTFDADITAQPNATTMFAADGGVPVLDGRVIIEMKFCADTPAVLKHLVEQFALSPAAISKYRLSLAELTARVPVPATALPPRMSVSRRLSPLMPSAFGT